MASQFFNGYWRGLLQRNTPRSQSPGFVNECLNVAFVGGVPVSRPGMRVFSPTACYGAVRGMGWSVDATGVKELLIAAGSKIQRCLPGGDPETLTYDYLPTADRARAEMQKVHFLNLSGGDPATIIYDGSNPNLMYSGGVLHGMGFQRGLTVQLGSHGGGGSIEKGTRKYVMTFDSGRHEGDPSLTPGK